MNGALPAQECPHCKQMIPSNGITNHIRRCVYEPERRERLRNLVPVNANTAEYNRLLAAMPGELVGLSTIEKWFGTFSAFMRWLHGDQYVTKEDELLDSIDRDLLAGAGALRNERTYRGVPVFEKPRREWTANGKTYVAWGVR
jgi:hypothetical protein